MSPGGKAGSILAVLPSYRDIRGTEGASSPFAAIPLSPVYRLSERSPSDPLFGVSTLGPRLATCLAPLLRGVLCLLLK